MIMLRCSIVWIIICDLILSKGLCALTGTAKDVGDKESSSSSDWLTDSWESDSEEKRIFNSNKFKISQVEHDDKSSDVSDWQTERIFLKFESDEQAGLSRRHRGLQEHGDEIELDLSISESWESSDDSIESGPNGEPDSGSDSDDQVSAEIEGILEKMGIDEGKLKDIAFESSSDSWESDSEEEKKVSSKRSFGLSDENSFWDENERMGV